MKFISTSVLLFVATASNISTTHAAAAKHQGGAFHLRANVNKPLVSLSNEIIKENGSRSLESIPDGATIDCVDHDNHNVYRWVNEKLCEYPSPEVASSWDEYWQEDAISMNCGSIDIGIPMGERGGENNFISVQCQGDPTNSIYYRPIEDGVPASKLRPYPSDEVAASWDDYWSEPQLIDCTGLDYGDPMLASGLVTELSDIEFASTVKCYGDASETIYRWSFNQLHPYPTPEIASSWDPDWSTTVATVDCTSLFQGDPMELKQGSMTISGTSTTTETGLTETTRSGLESESSTVDTESSTVDTEANPEDPEPNPEDPEPNPEDPEPNPEDPEPTPEIQDPEGKSVYCEGDTANVYRLTDGQLRLYPSGPVASSWDENWRGSETIDCSSIPTGPPMLEQYVAIEITNSGETVVQIVEGTTVTCNDDSTSIYRWTDNKLRQYTTSEIAYSWDADWSTSVQVVDCTSLAFGSPMLENGIDEATPVLLEGSAIKCDDGDTNIYRWTDGKLRLYPTAPIATSWDESWRTPLTTNCARLQFGTPMLEKGLPDIVDGKTVQCEGDSENMYRWTDGHLRLYPSDSIASSWDENWSDSIEIIDCTILQIGSPMQLQGTADDIPSIVEGATVACLGDGANIYRWVNGELRHYPSGPIATSWDENWRSSTITVDCSNLVFGEPMSTNSMTVYIEEGSAVQCEGAPCIFRWTGGKLRPYAGPTAASSWDENWRTSYTKIDCSNIELGSPMLEKGSTDHLTEGGTIKCNDGDENLYRWHNDQLRHYTTKSIATSWNTDWLSSIQIVDCSKLPFGSPMLKKGLPDIIEGRAVQCDGDDTKIYRWTDGLLRQYPSSTVATLWDPTWRNFVQKIDCTNIPVGPPLLDLPEEGATVQCEGDSQHIYRWTKGQLRSYPTERIASSWNTNWSDSIQTADCRVLPFGPPMVYQGTPDIVEGRSIQCIGDSDSIYRWTNGELRLYPTGPIATSWDENWREFVETIDCSPLPTGSPMEMKGVTSDGVVNIPEGQAVQCNGDSNIYRWTEGKLRLYPNGWTATAYDENWRTPQKVDCTSLTYGPPMEEIVTESTVTIAEGQAVFCNGDTNVYRWTDGELRLYPNGPIATSWDENWRNFQKVDCTDLPYGSPMEMKEVSVLNIPEGQAVQCAGDSNIYRWTEGKLRPYPNGWTATAYDENWRTPLKVDCTSLTYGPPMEEIVTITEPTVTIIPEGQAVQCKGDSNVYRWTDGELRVYPSGPIATSWDKNWRSLQKVDCTDLSYGSPMEMKEAAPVTAIDITEGQAVQCAGDSNVYRWTDGELRAYPSGPIATSWDDNWRSFITIDCSSLTYGSPMEMKEAAPMTAIDITEGQAVQCAGDSNVYRWTDGELRAYPSGPIATSWDDNWRSFITIDCSSLTYGSPMEQKIVTASPTKSPTKAPTKSPTESPTATPLVIAEGQAVECDGGPDIYRWTEGELRIYLHGSIATSWDGDNWRTPLELDCTSLGLPVGLPMGENVDVTLSEGQAVLCDGDTSIYRWTEGELRKYPSGWVATSWDENWRTPQSVNCATLSIGSPMEQRVYLDVPEGSAVQCSGDLTIYRWTDGELREYPTDLIAASWDENWNNFEEVNCSSVLIGSVMTSRI